MNARTHHPQLHTTPHGRKASHPNARPSRTALVRTRSGHSTVTQSSVSRSEGRSTAAFDVDDEVGGMETFLQFCTTCERQIVIPGGSILYCSEACRRKDVSPSRSLLPSPDYHLQRHHHEQHHSHHTSDLPPPTKTIIPPRSPTVLRPISGHMDLSPAVTPLTTADAEAACFLTSRFPCDPWVGSIGADNHYFDHRHSTTSIPSLSHTPSSSVGTSSSLPFRTSRHASAPNIPSSTITAQAHHSTRPSLPGTSPTHLMCDGPSSLKSRPSTGTCMRVAEADHHAAEHGPGQHKHPSPTQRRISQAQGSLRQLCEPAVSPTPTVKQSADDRASHSAADATRRPAKQSCSRGKAALYFI